MGGLVIAVALVVIGLIYFFFGRRPNLQSLGLKLLHIKIRQSDRQEEKQGEPLKEINLTEQFISSLSSLHTPFVLEVAVSHIGEAINFYLAVPGKAVDFAARAVQGLFPDSQVDEVPDYNIFSPSGAAASAYLTLAQSYYLPLRTYREAEVDTFAPIVSNFSKLSEVGEGAALQLVFKPAPDSVKKSIISAVERLKKGTELSEVLKSSFISAKDVRQAVAPGKKSETPKPVDEEAVKALQAKVSKQLFSVNARIVTSGESQDRAQDLLTSIAAGFSQFSAPVRNQIKLVQPRNSKKLLYQYSFREFDLNQTLTLNTEEIASLLHLPGGSTDVPRIKWLKTKEAPPPDNLPDQGVILGESVFRADHRLVRLTDDDRRRHLYIIGQTGTGKSAMMENMALQDIESGRGVCVVDPHGDLIDRILSLVPKERVDDVVVFDPGDLMRPLGLNMLEYNTARPEEKTFIVNEMQSIFNRLFSQETMGPMFEQYMRNSLLLLMEDARNEPATLVEVPRVFTDEAFRRRKLARITNPVVVDFWEKEASKVSGEASLANMSPYITSKFGNFIANDYVRPIIGQIKSAFNFREVMDQGKILLVNLSKGRIGDINAGLLGMVVVGRILMASLSRVDVVQEERRDFYLYIDEFQNFTTDSISVILSEARKYRLNLNLAHQFIEQLEEKIRDSVFGNVGSKVAFRVGVPDTELLAKEFAPVFSDRDLISIENYNAFAKLLVRGEPTKPFNFKTLPPQKGSRELAEKLRELSRLTYGVDNAEVERDIYQRLRS